MLQHGAPYASSYPAQQQRLHHPYQAPHQQQPLHHHHHLHLQQPHAALRHDVYAPPSAAYQAPLLLAPAAYRPLQMPVQQQQTPPHSTSQVTAAPDQHQQLAALAHQQATTPASFASSHAPDPGLHLHLHHNHNHSSQHPQAYPQQRQSSQQQNQHSSNMAYQPTDEEMAEMQRLSAGYESEVTVRLMVASRSGLRSGSTASLRDNKRHSP